MTRIRTALATTLLASAVLLAACNRSDPAPAPQGDAPSDAGHAPTSMIGKAARKGIDKAKREILAGNISLSDGINVRGPDVQVGNDSADPSRPKAEITPQGDLLIEGRKVAADASQQALLKRYRGDLEQVVVAGLEIGAQGADLAGKAVGEAISGIFSGDPDGVGKRVEAEAEGIKAAARTLCERLPGLYDTQQALAASLPAFKPYATMDQQDIDDCYRDHDTAATPEGRAQVRDEVRSGIRDGVRKAVQSTVGAVDAAARRHNAAAEAEAAPATRDEPSDASR